MDAGFLSGEDLGGVNAPPRISGGINPPTNFYPFPFKIDILAPTVLPSVAMVPQAHSFPFRIAPRPKSWSKPWDVTLDI